MIKFDILNRFSGAVQFTADIDADKNETPSVKIGLAVKWAVKNRANLYGANLNGANLNEASLNGANLYRANLNGASLNGANLNRANLNEASLNGANLDGANLNEASGVNDYVKCIHIDQYPITYTADILQIGCQRHAIKEWADFDDHRIAEMDGKSALKFWRKYKDWIFQTIEMCPARPTVYIKQEGGET